MWLRVSRKQGPVICLSCLRYCCYFASLLTCSNWPWPWPTLFIAPSESRDCCSGYVITGHWCHCSSILMFTLPRPALYCFTVASCLDRTQTRPQDHWPTPGLTVLTRLSARNSVPTLGLLHKNFSQTEAQNSICYILACPSPSPEKDPIPSPAQH